MSRTLAIEWNAQQARYALGDGTRRGALKIKRAGTIMLPTPAAGERLSAAELGRAIRDGLSEAGVRASAAVVGVNRSAVELRQLALPPAPDDELPELVKHQAAREFTALADDAALDFVEMKSESPPARAVMAAALPGSQLAYARDVCRAANIKPQRFVLRPYSAASLVADRAPSAVALIVDLGEDETDLTVLVEGQVFLCRTVRGRSRTVEADESAADARAASDASDVAAPLVAEIRRTAIAVRNQSGGGSVEAVSIFGNGPAERELAEQLRSEMEVPVELFDPWQGVELRTPLDDAAEGGRYAALVAMLADDAADRHTAFDFLNPRRRPEPVNRRRLAFAAAAGAALVALAGAYFAWGQFAEVQERIERLETRSRELDQLVKRGAEKQAAVAAIEEWSLGDVVWLDELRDLSLRFPQPRDAVLSRLTLTSRPTGGGAIELEGLVRDPSIVGRMESQLRDEYHEIRTRRVQESVQGKSYTWRFDSSLWVSRRSKDDYLAYLPFNASVSRAAEAAESASGAEAADPLVDGASPTRLPQPPGDR